MKVSIKQVNSLKPLHVWAIKQYLYQKIALPSQFLQEVATNAKQIASILP